MLSLTKWGLNQDSLSVLFSSWGLDRSTATAASYRSAAVSSKYPHGSPTSSSLHHPKHAAAPEFPSISIPSPFPECPIGKITQNVVFSNWLLSNIN